MGHDELISIAEYAKMHGVKPNTVRKKILRGGYKTAVKIGRNWVISRNEPYTDKRKKEAGRMKVKNLMKITRQESGVVLYDGGDLIICNWSNIDGMPRLSPGGLGLLGLNEELVVDGEPERIEDIGAWLDTQEHRVIYDANDDYPLLAGLGGKLYRVNGAYVGAYVIAPNGWN